MLLLILTCYDFLIYAAEAYKLPYLPPYLALTKDQNIHPGVNFAVAGATALDTKFFIAAGLGKFLWTNNSLNIQLGWFKKLKPSLCTTKLGNTENQTKTLAYVFLMMFQQ